MSNRCEKFESSLSTAITSSSPFAFGTKLKVSAGSLLSEMSESMWQYGRARIAHLERTDEAGGVYIRVIWFICMPLKFGCRISSCACNGLPGANSPSTFSFMRPISRIASASSAPAGAEQPPAAFTNFSTP